jgi:predicted RNase H-like HicB family nuclease
MRRFAVVFEKAESNWAAYVPDLPGCITTGSTLQETKHNIREAIELHLEAMMEVGEPIPEPRKTLVDVGQASWPVFVHIGTTGQEACPTSCRCVTNAS